MRTAADRKAEAARYQQLSEQATTARKRAAIESIVEKLEEVDAMIQETLGACDLCWTMHNDIVGMIDELEEVA